MVESRYVEPESVSAHINDGNVGFPFIAPDSSYLLFTRRNEIDVRFPDETGQWGEPVSLGPEYEGRLPIVSSDGRYPFLGRDQRAYGAEAGITAELRAKKRQGSLTYTKR